MSDDERSYVIDRLVAFVRRELLDGKDVTDFTTTTPLLDWGLLNSIETTRLVAYIRDEFGVRVPPTDMVSRHFKDVESITDLVTSLRTPVH
ncbi:MAG TPA: acyl carrier protein [Pseudonocardiaceae bacterium]|jgi:acyl carrier protein|nr:acyl carrier protein [Pseudonocardiaceae bacterium]